MGCANMPNKTNHERVTDRLSKETKVGYHK